LMSGGDSLLEDVEKVKKGSGGSLLLVKRASAPQIEAFSSSAVPQTTSDSHKPEQAQQTPISSSPATRRENTKATIRSPVGPCAVEAAGPPSITPPPRAAVSG